MMIFNYLYKKITTTMITTRHYERSRTYNVIARSAATKQSREYSYKLQVTRLKRFATTATTRNEKSYLRSGNSYLRTDNSYIRTDNSEVRTGNSEVRTDNSEVRSDNSERRSANSDIRSGNSELRNLTHNLSIININ